MTFNTCSSGLPLDWPSADWLCMSPFNGLRCPTNPTTGLIPPYTFPGFMQTNLKQPYTNQSGHIGIKIDSIGGAMGGPIPNFAGNMTYFGVEFGDNMTSVSLHDFNLFDG
jgi:hypothetical protein